MINSEAKQKLKGAKTLEEVKELLKDEPGLDALHRGGAPNNKRNRAASLYLPYQRLGVKEYGWVGLIGGCI